MYGNIGRKCHQIDEPLDWHGYSKVTKMVGTMQCYAEGLNFSEDFDENDAQDCIIFDKYIYCTVQPTYQ